MTSKRLHEFITLLQSLIKAPLPFSLRPSISSLRVPASRSLLLSNSSLTSAPSSLHLSVPVRSVSSHHFLGRHLSLVVDVSPPPHLHISSRRLRISMSVRLYISSHPCFSSLLHLAIFDLSISPAPSLHIPRSSRVPFSLSPFCASAPSYCRFVCRSAIVSCRRCEVRSRRLD